jgi:hypothetical protein
MRSLGTKFDLSVGTIEVSTLLKGKRSCHNHAIPDLTKLEIRVLLAEIHLAVSFRKLVEDYSRKRPMNPSSQILGRAA